MESRTMEIVNFSKQKKQKTKTWKAGQWKLSIFQKNKKKQKKHGKQEIVFFRIVD